MTTVAADGLTKYNWVLYGIPPTKTALAKDSYGVGTLGQGSDGPSLAYQPPCSQGLGSKSYTYTVYALSAAPIFAATTVAVQGSALATALAAVTLGKASLNVTYNRLAAASGLTTPCGHVRNSIAPSSTGNASVGCDSNYAYVASNGMASHAMMNGITATNLQVPTEQNFFGANAWRIPLNPAVAATKVTAADGPIGVAINGVPIFNPCKQGGCQNGDTKVLGELDICNGHAGRADDYHYHAAPTCLMATKPASYWDTHPLGWALDGFAIFGYNNADGSVAARDGVCGGNTSAVANAPAGYSYHVTDSSPYVLSCFNGTPSPDLAGQGAKFGPIRKPPVTPFPVSGMTLSTDATDGYQVLKFTSAQTFVTTETGTDATTNLAGTYNIRYKAVTGTALAALLALPANSNKAACWNFQFTTHNGATTQPTIAYCK
jgi:YHYH protein/Phosphatidylethanolamine-binding protein